MLHSPSHPQCPYGYELQAAPKKKKNNRRRNKKKQPQDAKMINAVYSEWDYATESPYLPKMEDPGNPEIECMINQLTFTNIICDTGSGVNIMPEVIYEFIYGKLPLYPTYTQLQMADQSYQIPEGITKDVPVQIKDHFVPTDFIVLDTRDEDINSPIVLGRLFLNTTQAIIYIRTGEIHFQFPSERYAATLQIMLTMDGRRRCAIRGDVNLVAKNATP